MQTRVQTETALMIAVCVAIGYALAWIPNIELFSTAVFTSGVLRGRKRGATVGLLAALLFFGLNPNGISSPPLFVTQLLGTALFGWSGGIVRPVFVAGHPWWGVLGCATAGFVVTLIYDVLTNTAGYLTFRTGQYMAYLLGGLSFPFPLAREIQNLIAFAMATPAVWRAATRWRPD